MLQKTADVVIIGGGVMGASTGYHLARRGVRNVVLLERDEFFGTGATGKCAGGVRHQFATEVNIRLSLASLPMFERFEEEVGQALDDRRCGYLFLLTREQDVAVFQRNMELQRSLGVSVDWWTGDEVRRRYPFMQLDDVLGATFGAEDGLVDPSDVVQGYMSAARRLGVRTLTDVEVTGIEVEADRIRGVQTSVGNIATDTVVNATGPFVKLLGAMAGVELPVQPVRRQMMVTSALPEIPADYPFVIDFAQSLYFHREGEGLLTGMSNHDEPPGFDERVDPDFELVTLEAAMQRMPLLEDAGMASRWAGLYEVTPDAHPIFGATPVKGFWVVGGFSGHGFMHGPIAGLLMAEMLVDGQATTVDVSSLDLARFQEGRQIQEYNVI